MRSPGDIQRPFATRRRLAGLLTCADALPFTICDRLQDPRCYGVISSQSLGDEELAQLRFALARPSSARRPLHPCLPLGERGQYAQATDYAGKDQLVLRLCDWATGLGASRRSVAALEQAVDELLLNALYDAPTDAAGTPRYVGLSPKERLQITAQPGEAAQVRFAADARRLVVAVRDPFGRLLRSTVLRYFRRCAEAQLARQSPLEQKMGGSGVGLFLVLGAASELFFRLRPGRFTEVVYTVYRDRPAPLRALLIDDLLPDDKSANSAPGNRDPDPA